MGDQRNLLIAIALSVAIMLGFQFFYDQPRQKAQREAQPATPQAESLPGVPPAPPVPGQAAPVGGLPPVAAPAPAQQAVGPRIAIQSARLSGSIDLRGARFDTVILNDYKDTVGADSPPIRLLLPAGGATPYYAEFGWSAADPRLKLPDGNTLWQADRQTLSPGQPVTLNWDNGAGLRFELQVQLDDNYLFTVTRRVRNAGDATVTLYSYGRIVRTGTPVTANFYILHEGPLGVFDGVLDEVDYDDLKSERRLERRSTGGWIGITDKYWLAALVPDQKAKLTAGYRYDSPGNVDRYQVDMLREGLAVPADGSAEASDHLFAGAKEVHLLDRYMERYGIAHFDKAVDFGWFYFLTKPLFLMLDYFYKLLGNFGLAILLLTVMVKLVFFPLANKSYRAMSKMKALQPEMMRLRDRHADDRQNMNQALMELYKKEKVNPAAGCLPIVIQIPVFFALYKVLFVTIEMRHAPFYGWIRDLSAPDPTTIFNLFGLIQWTPPEFLLIGIWPLLMGGSMYLQQLMNPQPADPVQAKIFLFMPVLFTFMLGTFPAGLVIYWTWNNVLSIAQQWVIMKRMGVPIGVKA
ncbi:MAG: membrane protein insertase YidC [Alphaproteobacteria bacterium]|nr:membrane protein insertase YidC [Alphaproteobacteria bacterium]